MQKAHQLTPSGGLREVAGYEKPPEPEWGGGFCFERTRDSNKGPLDPRRPTFPRLAYTCAPPAEPTTGSLNGGMVVGGSWK